MTATKPTRKKRQSKIRTDLPETGLVRLPQILHHVPVGASTWWRWVASGKAPKGIKLGEKTTAWKAEDIHALIESLGQNGEAA